MKHHSHQLQSFDALTCLRSELTPLGIETHRVHQLSTFLMYSIGDEQLHVMANWAGSGPPARQSLLQRLQSFLPPDVMLPPQRLQV